jgi:hypothetical protein
MLPHQYKSFKKKQKRKELPSEFIYIYISYSVMQIA